MRTKIKIDIHKNIIGDFTENKVSLFGINSFLKKILNICRVQNNKRKAIRICAV